MSSVTALPKAVALPLTVIELLASFAFDIEPANIASVIPNAFTRSVSELVSIELSSTFTASDNAPVVQPPDKPSPAVTLSISPASFVKLITPVELSYDKSPLADIKPLTCDVDTARSIAPSFASS